MQRQVQVPVKVIVAGGRDFTDYHRLAEELDFQRNSAPDKTFEVVTGMAVGADSLAYKYAIANKLTTHKFYPDWDKYGKAAGFTRNKQMAEYADALVAFWDSRSRGTKHMIETMRNLGKPVITIWY